jgi:cobalamin-dependent methionine synthase I
MPLIKDIQIKVPREEVLRLLKHKKDTTVIDEQVSNLINKLIEDGRNLSEPKAIYNDYIVKSVGDHSVLLEGAAYSLLGKSTAHRLWNAQMVTLFIVTIGPGIEKKIQEFIKQGSMANAAILDAIGSAAVESAVNYINELTNKNAKDKGYKTVQRFSPGYGDWELKEQKGLLQQLNASQINVTLTSAHLMQPEKSVSGVIGWVK